MPATAQVRIAADTAQFKKAMADVNKTMGKLGRNVGILRKSFNLLGASIGTLGKLGSGVGLPAILGASAKTFASFEKNVAEVFTLLPKANRGAFNEMSKDALKFSEQFGVLPQEVTRGMYQSISAGVSPEKLMEDDGFLQTAQKSAVAGVTDLKTAVDAFTNVINSYGEGIYDVAQVSDMMFKAVSMSKTTFRELSDYMYQILPTAGSLGVRLDDLLGSISALAATGTLTRVGTTQLRQMFIELGRTGDKANSAFLQASGGTPFQQFIRDGGRLTEVIAMIGDVAKMRGTDLRNLFGSVEAGNAAIGLFNSQSVKGMISELDEDSGAAAGSMSKAFEVMANTLSFKFAKLQRTIMNLFIRVGDVIKPVLKDIISELSRVVNNISNLNWDKLRSNFYTSYTAIKQIIKEGKVGEFLSEVLAVGLRKFVSLSLQAVNLVRAGVKSIADTPLFKGSADKITGGLKSVWIFIKDSFSQLMTTMRVGLDDFVNSLSTGLKNGILEALSVIPVYFSGIVNRMATQLMNLPIVGPKIAKLLYKSQYEDEDEAANQAQKEVGFKDNLSKDRSFKQNFSLSPNLFNMNDGTEKETNFDVLRKQLGEINVDDILKALRTYTEFATNQGSEEKYGKEMRDASGNKVSKNETYDKYAEDIRSMMSDLKNTEIPIDFKKLSELQKIISKLDAQYTIVGFDEKNTSPINPAKTNGGFDKNVDAEKFNENANNLRDEALSSGGRSQDLSEIGVKERAEKFVDQALNLAKKSIEVLEEKYSEFFTLPDYSKSNDAIKDQATQLEDGAKELRDRINNLLDSENIEAEEEKIKNEFENLVNKFMSFGKKEDKMETKYTDGGIPKTPPADTWDLLKRQVGVVADSMQKVGGGGNTSGTVSPMERNTSAINKLTSQLQKSIANDITIIEKFQKDFKQDNIRNLADQRGADRILAEAGGVTPEAYPGQSLLGDDLFKGFGLPEFKLPNFNSQETVLPEFKVPKSEKFPQGFVFPEFKLPEAELSPISKAPIYDKSAAFDKFLEASIKFGENIDIQKSLFDRAENQTEFEMNY